jgi:enamine deaminase RidA (YjgF/YER057c/UK114 family)
MLATEKLKLLDITLPQVPSPKGSYQPAVQVDNLVYVSGQLPIKNGNLLYAGRVPNEVAMDLAKDAAALCFVNALASLSTLDISIDQIEHVVKLSGYVQSEKDFQQHPQIINGASDLCLEIFGEKGVHSRIAVGVYTLPLNAPVELEALFQLKPTRTEK